MTPRLLAHDRAMRSRRNPRTIAFELGIVALLFVYYVGGNLLFEGDREPAADNARSLVALQERLGLNVEGHVQAFFEPHAPVMWFLILFYAGPHFALTIGFLVWVFWSRFPAFAHVRNAFLLFTTSAFAFQWVFPVAPPRYVPELGLNDSVTQTLPVHGETPWVSALINEVGALPSVHTGWALMVAIFAVRLCRGPWRYAWYAYPALVVVSIIATANHFVWDIVAAVAWLGLAEMVHAGLQHRFALPRFAPAPSALPIPEEGP